MRVMRGIAGNSLPFLRNMAEKVIYMWLGRKYPAITRHHPQPLPFVRLDISTGPSLDFLSCGS